MSAVTNLLPKIEGFQPIPNAVMIPFMEVQSAALAYGFGLNYEFGKRKIRSMSNEQYNSLTSEQIAAMSAEHSEILLQSLIQAVPKVMPAQAKIFEQYVAIEKLKVLQNVELAKWVVRNAPQILIKGTTDETSIRTGTSGPTIPSPGGTAIRQDSSGNVTTTYTQTTREKQAAMIKQLNVLQGTQEATLNLYQTVLRRYKAARTGRNKIALTQVGTQIKRATAERDALLTAYVRLYGSPQSSTLKGKLYWRI